MTSRAQDGIPTRQAILGAAERCMAECGFAGARLADITAAVGVTTGALYRYFPGKGALFAELVDLFEQDAVESLGRSEGLAEAMRRWLSAAKSHAGTVRALFELARPGTGEIDRFARLRAKVVEAFGAHLPVPDEERLVLSRVLVDLLLHCALAISAGWSADRAAQLAANLARLVGNGLYADETSVPPRSEIDIATRPHDIRPGSRPFIQWKPAEGKEGPRSTRGQKTWESVRRAALRAFEDHGLAGTTALDISRIAGVSSGTVYRYFLDKEDIFRSLQATAEADIVRETHLPLVRGRLAIRATLLAYFEVYRRHIALFRVWQELLQRRAEAAEPWIGMRANFVDALTKAIRFGQQVGIADAGCDASAVGEIYSLCDESVVYTRLILGWDADLSDERVATCVERLFIGGFSRPA
ncbi:TetR/AcrR family transcriptional regulator [Amycolatopsis rubida]|uniref:DNA-binding transcriptional regulator, AcrR family n=1 Tax=Amycolatopsis rubida TaxID=112413 RepID=A0A1I5SJ97_9PSEU|nr:TetR/AcrR family transcriptional regulator [Amycolatopsis rubida]SFP70577.1 DNA-binding transcriptional regulator, AcrR family [Amycolatopsis rubida]